MSAVKIEPGISLLALSVGTMVTTMMSPQAALAQTAPVVDPTSESDASETSAASGDIIVTARRREERLQDVPIAVQAFSQGTLQSRGIERATDLVNVTPTLKISSASQRRQAPAFELRSISSTESNIGQDSPVALYINEVYLGRPVGTTGAFVDLENVQVLLGPQGTLFGRNATAGAVLVTTRRPEFDFGGEVSATYGNYDQRRLTGIVNVPLGDTVALRVVGAIVKRDGYTYDITNNQTLDDEDSWYTRGSLLLKSGAFENLLVADYYKSDENGSGTVPLAIRPQVAGSPAGNSFISLLNGNANTAAVIANQRARGPRVVEYSPGSLLYARAKANGASNITTYEINDDLTLKNVAGYRYVRLETRSELDATRFVGVHTQVAEQSRSFSNELQLQGQALGNALDYIVGLYYFNEKGLYNSVAFQFGALTPVLNTEGRNESYSVFAQGTYHIPGLDGLNFTLGARYTKDKREILYLPPNQFLRDQPFPATVNCTYTPVVPNCTNGNSATFTKPTWTATVDYKPNNDLLLYIAHRRGYRSGGFNSRDNNTISQIIPFGPETVTDVEAGIKATWRIGDVRVQTNAAAYYNWYDDIQRTIAITNPQGGLLTVIANAAKATVEGFEANIDLSYQRIVELSIYYGYSDAIHKEFNTTVNNVPASIENVPFGSLKHSGGAAFTARPPMDPSTGQVSMTLNAAYSGSYFNTTSLNLTNVALPTIDPTGRVPARVIFNGSIEWENIANTNLSAQFFVRNITNKQYLVSTLALFNTAAGFTSGLYGEPRLYGLTLSYRF